MMMRALRRRRRRCGPHLPLPWRRPRRHCRKGTRSSSTRHPPLDPVALRGFLLGLFPPFFRLGRSLVGRGSPFPFGWLLPLFASVGSDAGVAAAARCCCCGRKASETNPRVLFPVRQLDSGGSGTGVWAQAGRRRRCRAGPDDADRSTRWFSRCWLDKVDGECCYLRIGRRIEIVSNCFCRVVLELKRVQIDGTNV
jgi:hypothetical protein